MKTEIVIPGVVVETPDGEEIRPSQPVPPGRVSIRPNEAGVLCWYVEVEE